MRKMDKKGQSTVEYVLLVSAVIAVVIAFTSNSNTGVQQQLGSSLNQAFNQVGTMSNRYANSLPTTNAVAQGSQITVDIMH